MKESLKMNTIIYHIFLATGVLLVFQYPDQCEAVRCYSCWERLDDHPFDNCLEGGVPNRKDGSVEGVEENCDGTHGDTDPNQCLMQLSFKKGSKMVTSMKKGCSHMSYLDCVQASGLSLARGGCIVINETDFDALYAKCFVPSKKRFVNTGSFGAGLAIPSTTQVDLMAYCRCTGDFCNKNLQDSQTKELFIARKSLELKRHRHRRRMKNDTSTTTEDYMDEYIDNNGSGKPLKGVGSVMIIVTIGLTKLYF